MPEHHNFFYLVFVVNKRQLFLPQRFAMAVQVDLARTKMMYIWVKVLLAKEVKLVIKFSVIVAVLDSVGSV